MISYRQADIFKRVREKQHGNYMGTITLLRVVHKTHEVWIVPGFNYVDMTDVVKGKVMAALHQAGAVRITLAGRETAPLGWEIVSYTIEDIVSDLRNAMEEHDLGIVRNDMGESEISITYQTQV
jgi:ribosomal protein S19E (S16A)